MTIAPPLSRRSRKALPKALPKAAPQPTRPHRGGTDPGPRDRTRDRENPDLIVPPATDEGILPNLRFSFADAHMRLERGEMAQAV